MYRPGFSYALVFAAACLLFGFETPGRGRLGQDGSRAGDVQPAADYEVALADLIRQVVDREGLVHYDRLRGDLNDDFRKVLKAVEEFDQAALVTEQERLAFWLNAYNVQMLQNIVETPQVKNLLDEGYADAFFKTPFRTAKVAMSLDEIEHVILRKQDGRDEVARFRVDALDPRIHVGLNCAARSCPRLRAFTAEKIDAELDIAMREFMGSTRHVRIEGEHVVLSSLLDWFGSDFNRTGKPAGDFLLAFVPPSRPDYEALAAFLKGRDATALKTSLNVRFEYYWTVNEAG